MLRLKLQVIARYKEVTHPVKIQDPTGSILCAGDIVHSCGQEKIGKLKQVWLQCVPGRLCGRGNNFSVNDYSNIKS